VRLTSELGRTEFAMVALTEGPEGMVAHPVAKGSGAVTAFAQADGFLTMPALTDSVPPGTRAEVTLFGRAVTPPALAVVGSHCVGLDAVVGLTGRSGADRPDPCHRIAGRAGRAAPPRMRHRADPSARPRQRRL
jgi:putative molybdopterin biosynthesis protein